MRSKTWPCVHEMFSPRVDDTRCLAFRLRGASYQTRCSSSTLRFPASAKGGSWTTRVERLFVRLFDGSKAPTAAECLAPSWRLLCRSVASSGGDEVTAIRLLKDSKVTGSVCLLMSSHGFFT